MKRQGFTLWEALGVVVALGIIAAILFPVMTPQSENRPRYSCQSQMKQIALGVKQYLQDYDNFYPLAKNSNKGLELSASWPGELQPYLKTKRLFQCPSDSNATDNERSSYGYNARLSKINEEKLNMSAVIIMNYEVIADENGWTQTGGMPGAVSASTRHLDGANFSFVDGHVKWLKPGKATALPADKGEPTFMPG